MATISEKIQPTGDACDRIDLLANGDRLTRDEFERRYAAMKYCRAAWPRNGLRPESPECSKKSGKNVFPEHFLAAHT